MGQLRIPRNLAVAVGVEPTPFLINSQAGYRLPNATLLEPTVGIAPTSPRYEGGILLLNYVGLEGATGFAPAHSRFAGGRVTLSPRAPKIWVFQFESRRRLRASSGMALRRGIRLPSRPASEGGWRRGQDSNLHVPKDSALAPRWLTVRRTSPDGGRGRIRTDEARRPSRVPDAHPLPAGTTLPDKFHAPLRASLQVALRRGIHLRPKPKMNCMLAGAVSPPA